MLASDDEGGEGFGGSDASEEDSSFAVAPSRLDAAPGPGLGFVTGENALDRRRARDTGVEKGEVPAALVALSGFSEGDAWLPLAPPPKSRSGTEAELELVSMAELEPLAPPAAAASAAA